ncbi:MAG: Uncharacterised protein [Opitutia bacterium UBA7350]|nr:MAG: Uncharacterised protein [Opitutae bacterium UBA7350]
MKSVIAKISLIGLIAINAGCQNPIAVDYDYAQLNRITNYTKYTIETREERANYGTIALSPLVDRRIENAIHNNLEDNGYGLSVSADFRINFHTATKDRTNVHDLGYGPAPFGREPYFGDYSYGRLFIDKFEEGTLVIDIIDNETHQLIWRGSHTRRMRERALNNLEAQAIVDAILLNFHLLSAGTLD